MSLLIVYYGWTDPDNDTQLPLFRELARRVGTTASVICQLENADYQGHSLSLLKRIAAALGKRVEIRFRPLGSQKA